jgi:peptidoglycan hydrolase-like protein with peptidoglycan-binding domain
MSVKNLGIVLLSSALVFGFAPIASAEQHQRSKAEVQEIQTALRDAGFDPGPIDGVLGPQTTKAIRTFQFHSGTLATGKLNDETLATLGVGTLPIRTARVEPLASSIPDELARVEEDGAPLPNEATEEAFIRDNLSIPSDSTLSNREDIRHIQHALTELAYNPGEVNGMMSSETQQAVREFQLLNGLPVTGTVDQRTKLEIDAAMRGGNAYDFELTRQKPGQPAPHVREAHPSAKKDATTKQ